MAYSNQPIDLRSDTVTQPTPAMREAMAQAPLGDDVYGEDPTVNRLEALAAEMLGKESAVLVSSGTMGNLISVMAHCGRGDELIVGSQAHIYLYEQGGSAALGGIHPRAVTNQPDGTLDLDEVAHHIRGDDEHFPITRLLCIENTHNRCNGSPLPVDYLEAIGELAHGKGLSVHMDGARLWNAAVALNKAPAELTAHVDSVSCCLSKGLAAPVGSLVAGSSDFIQRARRMRKVVGGGMRQAGILAACGIVSLTEMVERLSDDHQHAQELGRGLAALDGIEIELTDISTNIVYFSVNPEWMTAVQLAAGMQQQGVLMNPINDRKLRAVLNCDVSGDDVENAVKCIQSVLAAEPAPSSSQVRTYG